MSWQISSYFVFMLLAFYFDARKNIIPNWLNSIGALYGLVLSLLPSQKLDWIIAVSGLVTGFSVTFVLYLLGAVAAGDVKYFATAGMFLGYEQVILILVGAIFVAAAIAIILLAFRNNFRLGTFPFMFAVLPSSVLILWCLR
jgi:prepilin peptidase CpaA